MLTRIGGAWEFGDEEMSMSGPGRAALTFHEYMSPLGIRQVYYINGPKF